jgi:hypothetical protein
MLIIDSAIVILEYNVMAVLLDELVAYRLGP